MMTKPKERAPDASTRPRVLIVEDEAVLAMDLAHQTEQFGYAALEPAASGEDAIERARTARPDLVLMDIQLAGALDGIETAIAIRGFLDVPVIYLTAFTDDERVERAEHSDSYAYLVKPVQRRELRTAMSMALYKHRIDRALRESEARHRAVVESVRDVIFATDTAGRWTFLNPAWREITGFAVEDSLGRPFIDCVVEEDRAENLAKFRPLIEREKEYCQHQVRYRHADGGFRWIEVHARLTFDETGAASGTVGTLRDVTAQREAELRLRMLSVAIEQSPASIVITDRDGIIEYVNPAFARVTGHASEEALGRNPRFLQSGKTPNETYVALWDTILRGETWRGELLNRRKTGDLYWELASISGLQGADGRIHSFVAVKEDITARKRLEADLADTARRYRAMFAANPHPMWVYDMDTLAFLAVNDAAVRHYGYTEEEFLGMSLADIRPAEDVPALAKTVAGLGAGIRQSGIWRHRKKDGTEFLADIASHPVEFDGRTARVVLASDVTERLEAERRIQELNESLEQRVAARTAELQRANRDLEAFSYSVSHDLRAPLRAINGFAHILLETEHERLSPEGQENLGRVIHSAARLGQLIDDILEFSRVARAEPKRQPVDMAELARRTAGELGGEYPGATVSIGALPAAEGDAVMLQQVWANLIGNALKYSAKRERPEVHIRFGPTPQGDAYCVRDNGAGFDMAFADKLFGVFQRMHGAAEFPGTGVGLAIVKRIVERHGGRIWANASPDAGAAFYFTLGARAA